MAKLKTIQLLATLILLIVGSSAKAQQYDEYMLKAGFLEKIAKYITWPPKNNYQTDYFLIGVIGENPFGDKLERFYHEAKIHGASVKVKYYDYLGEVGYCNMLFINGMDDSETSEIVALANTRGILTVGDTDQCRLLGVHITFYEKEDGRLDFVIKADTLKKYGFRISYHLSKHSKS